MIYGSHTSGFGWNNDRKMVEAEDDVWNEYVKSHKDAAPFRTRAFPFFEELTIIYAKDRAKGRVAIVAEDAVEEMGRYVGTNDEQHETVDINVNEPPIDLSNISGGISGSPLDGSGRYAGSSSRKRKKDDQIGALTEFADKLSTGLEQAMAKLTGSFDPLQQKLLELPCELSKLEGLSEAEMQMAILKFGLHPNYVLLFFGLAADKRLNMVRGLISQ